MKYRKGDAIHRSARHALTISKERAAKTASGLWRMRPMLENALCGAKPIQPQAAMLTRAGGCLVLGGVRSGGFETRAAQTGHSGYGKVWA